MDRQRLEQVQQTDLTESKLNQDFVDWLKSSGPTWLLVILLGVCAFLGMNKWRAYKAQKYDTAWQALAGVENGDPRSAEDIAEDEDYANTAAISTLAHLEAGRGFLQAVALQRDLDATNPMQTDLAPEKREDYLAKADRNFQAVIDKNQSKPDRDLHVVQAMFGRAAVAESRGDLDRARELYDQAATKAQAAYPALAEVARHRATTAGEYHEPITLPSFTETIPTGTPAADAPVEPAGNVDSALRTLMEPGPAAKD